MNINEQGVVDESTQISLIFKQQKVADFSQEEKVKIVTYLKDQKLISKTFGEKIEYIQLYELINHLVYKHVDSKEYLCHLGARAENVMTILKGKVNIFVPRAPQQIDKLQVWTQDFKMAEIELLNSENEKLAISRALEQSVGTQTMINIHKEVSQQEKLLFENQNYRKHYFFQFDHATISSYQLAGYVEDGDYLGFNLKTEKPIYPYTAMAKEGTEYLMLNYKFLQSLKNPEKLKFDALKGIFSLEFPNVPDDEIKLLCSIMQQRVVMKDEIVFVQEDQPIDNFYIIFEGRLKILQKSVQQQDKNVILELIKKNSLFGQQEIYFNCLTRSYSTKVTTGSFLFQFQIADFQKNIQNLRNFSEQINKLSQVRFQFYSQKMKKIDEKFSIYVCPGLNENNIQHDNTALIQSRSDWSKINAMNSTFKSSQSENNLMNKSREQKDFWQGMMENENKFSRIVTENPVFSQTMCDQNFKNGGIFMTTNPNENEEGFSKTEDQFEKKSLKSTSRAKTSSVHQKYNKSTSAQFFHGTTLYSQYFQNQQTKAATAFGVLQIQTEEKVGDISQSSNKNNSFRLYANVDHEVKENMSMESQSSKTPYNHFENAFQENRPKSKNEKKRFLLINMPKELEQPKETEQSIQGNRQQKQRACKEKIDDFNFRDTKTLAGLRFRLQNQNAIEKSLQQFNFSLKNLEKRKPMKIFSELNQSNKSINNQVFHIDETLDQYGPVPRTNFDLTQFTWKPKKDCEKNSEMELEIKRTKYKSMFLQKTIQGKMFTQRDFRSKSRHDDSTNSRPNPSGTSQSPFSKTKTIFETATNPDAALEQFDQRKYPYLFLNSETSDVDKFFQDQGKVYSPDSEEGVAERIKKEQELQKPRQSNQNLVEPPRIQKEEQKIRNKRALSTPVLKEPIPALLPYNERNKRTLQFIFPKIN